MASASAWTWDDNRKDYYYVTRDYSGQYTYHYQHDQPEPASQTADIDRTPRTESLNHGTTLETVPENVRADPVFIQGTPGETERLDSSYRIRSGAEAHNFFQVGKVFAMLHVQAASANELAPINDNISIVKYGERAFAQIRRFVIVDVRRGFVYACPIFTYTKRGTLKSGCIASEHSVIYFSGSTPTLFTGEYERGLTKQHICVNAADPTDPSIRMDPASRLHYGKAYPIEMNVKVKDVGNVDSTHIGLLLQYYREESLLDSRPYNTLPRQDQSPPSRNAYTYSPPSQNQQAQFYSAQQYSSQGYPAQAYQQQTYQGPNYPTNYRY